MGISAEKLAYWLEKQGWDYVPLEGEDQSRFAFGVECVNGPTLSVEIALSERGEFLQLRTAELFSGKDLESSPYRRKVLSALAEETFSRRMAKFGYDLTDGEIDCCVDFPLERCPLTRRQFEYGLQLLILVARLAHERISHILKTGHDPGILGVADLPKG